MKEGTKVGRHLKLGNFWSPVKKAPRLDTKNSLYMNFDYLFVVH